MNNFDFDDNYKTHTLSRYNYNNGYFFNYELFSNLNSSPRRDMKKTEFETS